jgi:hypothetical protein
VRLAFEEPAPAGTAIVARCHPPPATLADMLFEGALDPTSIPGLKTQGSRDPLRHALCEPVARHFAGRSLHGYDCDRGLLTQRKHRARPVASKPARTPIRGTRNAKAPKRRRWGFAETSAVLGGKSSEMSESIGPRNLSHGCAFRIGKKMIPHRRQSEPMQILQRRKTQKLVEMLISACVRERRNARRDQLWKSSG